MSSHPDRGSGANTSTPAGPGNQPDPGPAPVGPAVHPPPQTPAETPQDPGPAPVGPAIHPERTGG
ncbi:hypothetical protein [Falsiroseomonas sp. CW058]|uniref:hypothetical protein n=1 Tax=Falsiroseomonas sp. CW058 TaxID=3388664 RepID=UPI003D31E2AE